VTEGPIARSLSLLAGPMLVSGLLQNMQSLIDLFWVGRLGSGAVAAVALSGTILMTLFPVVMGMSAGTVALVSRFVGARQPGQAAEAAGQSLGLALVFGLTAGLLGAGFTEPLCRLMGTPPEALRPAVDYLRISFLGSFTVFVLFLGNSALQGAGNAMTPMAAMTLATVLNLVLDPVFIFGWLGVPRLEVRGAALATVLAQAIAAVLVVARLSHGTAGLHVHRTHWWPRAALVWRLWRIGLPSSGQMLARSLMALVLMRVVAGCGTPAVAAYGIGLRFHGLVMLPAFALGNAAATMVGQNLGARQPGRAQAAAWLATGMDLIVMAVSGAVFMALAPHLIAVFDRSAEVVALGASYLRTVSPFYLFTGLAVVLGRSLQGAGDTVSPMLLTILCLWGLQVPLAVTLSRHFDPAPLGIWWAIAIAVSVHGMLTAAWFQTGRWKTRDV
jgi:putative MATE family efflux protein